MENLTERLKEYIQSIDSLGILWGNVHDLKPELRALRIARDTLIILLNPHDAHTSNYAPSYDDLKRLRDTLEKVYGRYKKNINDKNGGGFEKGREREKDIFYQVFPELKGQSAR